MTQRNKADSQAVASCLTFRPTQEQVRGAAKRIQELKVEYAAVKAQMARIQTEAAENWEILDQVLPDLDGSRPPKIQNPRPVEDKLIISAGKAIATAVKSGKSLEQTRIAAIQAATRVGKKYGLASIPSDLVAKVEGRAQKQFNAGR